MALCLRLTCGVYILYNLYISSSCPDLPQELRSVATGSEMFESESRVLLLLPQDVLDRVRVLAGKATTTLKLPVSVQIVLRALIMEGLKRVGDLRLLANIEAQAHVVRRIRGSAWKRGRAPVRRGDSPSRTQRTSSGPEPQRRGR